MALGTLLGGADVGNTTAWTFTFVGLTFALYLWIGWRSRVAETRGFYVAGQGVPALANGAATAADWMSAASFISMAGLISFMGSDGSMFLMGWTGGYVLLALLLAPYLRKFGQYTVPDFVGARYESETARIVAAICAIFVSLTYVAGQMRGVGIVFSHFLGVGLTQGVMLGMVIVAFFAVLGGMKGITWTQVAQFFVLIVAFLIPAVALSGSLTGYSVPQLGFTMSDLALKLDGIQQDLGFGPYTSPFATKSKLDVFCVTFALMVGTAGLPHVIVRFYTVPSVRAARYSAGWALLFIAILYTTAPALAAFARTNLLETLDGARIVDTESIEVDGEASTLVHLESTDAGGEAQPIAWVETWQRTGLVRFHDDDGNGTISLARVERGGKEAFAEAEIDRDIIVLSAPEVGGLPAWVIALVAAGGLAAALSTAAGLLLVISSSMAHDLYVHFVNPQASEERKVMIGRVMIVFAIFVAGWFGVNPPGFVGEVVALAFGLAAASFFPVILLGIFDVRTNRHGAVAGMVTGLGFTGAYILGNKWDKMFKVERAEDWIAPWYQTPWLADISPEGIGAVGCLIGFAMTFFVSRMTPPPSENVRRFVESVRVPKI